MPSNGDTSDVADIITPLSDLETDMNTPRPVVAGGTGASTAAGALVNFGLTATAAEINVLDGITASTAELNILDGVTATAAELNILDGVTATTAELNLLDGITAVQNRITWATEQATTSGTAFDFTGISATATEILVQFNGVSLSGTDSILVQLGDAGGFETTGYTSTALAAESTSISVSDGGTSGFNVPSGAAGDALTCVVRLVKDAATNRWLGDSVIRRSAKIAAMAGDKTLSATLTQVRVTRTGSNTFDLGAVNVGYR